MDSTSVSAADFSAFMGGGEVPAGDTLEGGVRLTTGAPFTAALVFRFGAPNQAAQSSRVRVDCGPTPDPGSSSPGLTDTYLRAPTPLEPGDTITIGYRVSSQIGVWLTLVELSGACTVERLFPERLRKEVSREVRIRLPADCVPGTSLVARVGAADALLRGPIVEQPPLAVVDQTPPTIYSAFSDPPTKGLFFLGESITARAAAQDNGHIRWFRWEVLPFGYRDSVAVNGPEAVANVVIPVSPQWNGLISLRIDAKDASGNVSSPLLSVRDSLAVAPTVDRPTVVASTGAAVWDLAIDAGRRAVYYVRNLSTAVTVVNTEDGSSGGTIPLPAYSLSLDLVPGGDTLVVSLPTQRALALVNLAVPTRPVSMLPLTALDTATQSPGWVRVGANRHAYVWIGARPPAAPAILDVDLQTGLQRFLLTSTASEPLGETFARSPDGGVMVFIRYGAQFQRYDVSTDQLGPIMTTQRYAMGLPTLAADGERVAVVNSIYDASLQPVRQVWSTHMYPAASVSTALTPDGASLYVASYQRGLVRVRVSDGMALDRSTFPFSLTSVRMSPDGRFAVVVGDNILAQNPGKIAFVTLP